MRQITEQLKLALTGGWFQGDFGWKKQYLEKDYGKKPFIVDWVKLLYIKLSNEISNYYTAWKSRAEFARGTGIVRADIIKNVPVTKRSKNDRHWITMYHVHKAAARLAKAKYEYRSKKHAWVFN